MFDIGWPELLLVGAVSLVAIGPEDFPRVMYAFGRWTRRVRRFIADMNRAVEQVSLEAEEARRFHEPPASPPPTKDKG